MDKYKKMLDDGIAHNFICYDTEARPQQITEFLLEVMEAMNREHTKYIFNKAIVPIFSIVQNRCIEKLGIEIEYAERDICQLILDYYKTDWVLPHKKENIIILSQDEEHAILGAF